MQIFLRKNYRKNLSPKNTRLITLIYLIGYCILFSPVFCCPSDISIQSIIDEGNSHHLQQTAEALFDCPEWQDSLGLVYHKLGLLNYDGGYGNIDSAIFFAEKALAVREVFYQKKAHLNLGKSYHNLGVYYKSIGELSLAKPNFESAIHVFRNLNKRKRLRRSQLELGIILSYEGDFQKSETIFRFLVDDTKSDEQNTATRILLNLGKTYIDQNKYNDALKVLKKAIEVSDQNNNPINLAASYHNLGLTYYNLKQFSSAILYYKKALEIYLDAEDCIEVAKIQNSLGLVYLKTEETKNAERYFDLGLNEAQLCEATDIIALSHDNLGELQLNNQAYEKANTAFSQAIQTLIPLLSTKTSLNKELKEALRQSSFKIDLLIYLSDKTRALKALYQQESDEKYLRDALFFLETGDYIIGQLRQNHNDQSTKLFWREEVLPFYEKAIEICTLLEDPGQAFFYFEKSKSILLLEALLSSNALQSIPDSLQREVKYLERQIRLQRDNLNQVKGSEKAEILQLILNYEEKLEVLNESLVHQFPQLKEFSRQNQVIDLTTFYQAYLLGKQRALVHYFYGAENVYALIISEGNKQVIKLEESGQINSLVRDYLQYFEQANRIESQPKAYLQQAAKVFDALVKPLDLAAQAELLIIPAGILTYLPFEALITNNNTDFGIANAPYLLLKHKLWYGFSATLFDQIERRSLRENKQSLLAFAPFANRTTKDYPSLSFSQDELSKIDQIVSMDLYQDEQATLRVFLNQQSNYNILHLSTHAFSSFSETQPFIVFSDSILTLADLYQHPISANLVVLSACQTQIGKLAVGEGVLGLNRGFFYAGARSVVSSLWNMNAQSTATILSNFYQAMVDGIPKFLALNQAKTTYLQDENIPAFQKSPYYWAGMNYYGDSEKLELKGSTLWRKYGLFLLLVLLLGVGIKRFR